MSHTLLMYNPQRNSFIFEGQECYNSMPFAYFFIKDLKAKYPNLSASTDALTQINKLKESMSNILELKLINDTQYVPRITPFLHQKEGAEYMLNYDNVGIVFQQGLGKTYTALMAIEYRKLVYKEKNKVLIVAPKLILSSWEKEIRDKTCLTSIIYKGLKPKRAKEQEEIKQCFINTDIILVHSEALISAENTKFLQSLGFHWVILDEASRIKGAWSKRAQALSAIAVRAKRVHIMSGTLSMGNPLDVYTPITIMNPYIFGRNYIGFKKTYCKFSPYNDKIVTGYKNLDKLKSNLDRYIVIRSRDECIDLPERIFEQFSYELNSRQVDLYNEIIDKDFIIIKDEDGIEHPLDVKLPIVKIVKLRQVLSGFINVNIEKEGVDYEADPMAKLEKKTIQLSKTKVESLKELLEIHLEEPASKVILWYFFKEEQRVITDLLESMDIPYIEAGSKPSAAIDFESSTTARVFLGQISQGIGITLNSAKTTIMYNHPLKLDEREQSLDRNYRIGQESKVLVIDMVVPGTLDEDVLNLLDKKIDVREFIQHRHDCINCEQAKACCTLNILPYSKDCIYGERAVRASKIKKIKLRGI